MKKTIFGVIGLTMFVFLLGGSTLRAETTMMSLTTVQQTQMLQQKLISLLRQRIEMLQVELAKLQAGTSLSTETVQTVLRLTKPLKMGASDEEVKLLQGVLLTDPELYPEGYQTGYFGDLTEKALRKFQKKAGLAETGEVDNKTIWKINELLTFGAGHSGKIPPGLLRAPGILKKLGLATTTPPGRDITVPVIISLSATSTLATSTKIIWQTNELAASKVWWSTLTPPVTGASTTMMKQNNIFVISHNLTLDNLATTTTYYYYVGSTDYAGNHATSTTNSFTTLSQ